MARVRLYTRSLVRASTLRRATFLETIRKNESVLNEKYFEEIAKQRSSVGTMRLKTSAIQIPILAFLVLSLIPIDASFSILGVSPGSNKNLREILIVASALIGVVMNMMSYYYDSLSDILAAHAQHRSRGKSDVEEMLKVAYGLDTFPLPARVHGNVQLGWGFYVVLGTVAFLLIVLVACLMAGALYIHFLILRDIYYKPSFSTLVSIWVIAFVLLCDTLSLIVTLVNSGLLITRNFANMMTVSKMSDEKSNAVYRRMWENHYRKPLLLRLLTRAKLPRKLG